MNRMNCHSYSILGTIPEVVKNYLKYRKLLNLYLWGAWRGWRSRDEPGCFSWFRQAHIVCWASPAPAAGTCFCCSLTFLWHCAECCLKRRECSQMIIIYPVRLRSSVWMLLKNIKPESQNSEGCSLRIILNTLATKWSVSMAAGACSVEECASTRPMPFFEYQQCYLRKHYVLFFPSLALF